MMQYVLKDVLFQLKQHNMAFTDLEFEELDSTDALLHK